MGGNVDGFEAVDLLELLGFGHRRAGHAGQLAVEAEIVLEGDRGEGDVLRLDFGPFLGFDRLVQPLAVAPPLHHPAGELVDDHHLPVAQDVVAIALEQFVGPQGLADVMHERRVLGVIERALLEQSLLEQDRFDIFVAFLRQGGGADFLVDFVMLRHQLRNQPVDAEIEIRAVLGGAGDDQRGARLIDQDRVDLIDNGVGVAALAPSTPDSASCCRADSQNRARCWWHR